ncbi:hypothetical protein, partial [Chryseobacterium echinoideorum]|uniref:hypothetical protein n=1 Tax=Chryseobacterium echinoideorum TaxID=1549648 RepID=UPI001625B3E0
NPPCTGTIIPTDPQPGFTDENGCTIGLPSLINLPIKNNPCEKILQNNIKAKEFLLKPKASGRIAEVKTGIANNANEKSFSLGVDNNGNEQVTNIFEDFSGTQTNIVAQSPNFKINAGVHTHSPGGAAPPSATDIYSFMKANKINSEFTLYYTISYDGNDYVFSIVDLYKFKNFATTYPENEYTDSEYGTWKYGNVIGDSFYSIFRYFKAQGKSKNESFELATAYILKKYNFGVGLSKKDGNGDFKPIFLEEQQDPNNPKKKIFNKTENCNL